MATPLASSPQASGAFFPADTTNTANNPAGNGVDSHHIEFQLGTVPNVMQVETVVGASGVESQKVDDALESLKLRLLEVYEKGSCLVSFGSSESFDRINETQNKVLRANSSSLVEQILAQQKNNPDNEIKLPNNVVLKPIARNTQTVDGWKFHTGEITFEVAGKPDKTIKFREFCPDYNGKFLDSATLLAALKHVPEPKPEDSHSPNAAANTTCPQFYSANGIGRSASLAVLYSFKEMCAQQNGVEPALVEQHLNKLIEQGRNQRHIHFVNSRKQKEQLLAACNKVNNEIIEAATKSKSADQASTDSSGPAATAAAASAAPQNPATSQDTREINPVIKGLAHKENCPEFVIGKNSDGSNITTKDKFPYMPINLDGITAIASKTEYKFPELSIKQAEDISTDIIKAGYYGDALGAELESNFYETRKHYLIQAMRYRSEKDFNDKFPNPADRDKRLINQLQKNNYYPQDPSRTRHHATDDTQQGALSAISKMNCILSDSETLNDFAGDTMLAFKEPKFPVYPQKNPSVEFGIRGGANTFYMCKFADKGKDDWHKVAIEDVELNVNRHYQVTGITPLGKRAGGAGNGGMMRIGYDLLPLLASGATTQDLIEQVLISNQVTHPSSFSAVACVGQVVLMAKCIHFRQQHTGKSPPTELPKNFFIDTYYDVAKAIEHLTQKFTLEGGANTRISKEPRLPSEFLKAADSTSDAIKAGSVERVLIESKSNINKNSSEEINSVLERWNTGPYLGATFPSVVFLLERFGYDNPALAVNMAALVTYDSDTCATIIAQVMGALHGSTWIDQDARNFNQDLGGGFTVENFTDHMNKFYNEHGKPQQPQPTT